VAAAGYQGTLASFKLAGDTVLGQFVLRTL